MKFLLTFFASVLLALSVQAQTQSRITATVTVTGGTTNGMTIVVNGTTRTWTNSVVTPSTQILTNSAIGGVTTNLFVHVANYTFTGPITLYWVATNQIQLVGALAQAMTVTASGGWATISYSTQTVSTLQAVRVPMSSEANSVRTNIATLLVTNLASYSQLAWASTAPILTNYVNVTDTQTISGAKSITNLNGVFSGNLTNIYWGEGEMSHVSSNSSTRVMGFYFRDAFGNYTWCIAPDTAGRPSIYDVSYSTGSPIYPVTPSSSAPNPANILNVLVASNSFGGLTWGNSFSGTNTFTRITNSAIVNSSLRYSSAVSGTLEALTNGIIVSAGITNATTTNTTYTGTNTVTGDVSFSRTDNTSLANGNNSGIDFGTTAFVKLKAGPTAAFAICGISGGRNGKVLHIYNSIAQNMTIANDSGVEPTAANRIYTGTGADIATTGIGVVNLIYDSDSSRWIVTSYTQ